VLTVNRYKNPIIPPTITAPNGSRIRNKIDSKAREAIKN